MRSLIAGMKMLAFLLITLLLAPLQIILRFVPKIGQAIYILPSLWHKCACKIFAIHVTLHGSVNTESRMIYAVNHLSYLDIPVLGSIIHASFVAKREVASWPIFGFLSKLQNTAFIDRKPQMAKLGADNLAMMLQAGTSLILFPEGTSTDGKSVLPFKSSLFALALPDDVRQSIFVQPVTIELKAAQTRDHYAWYADMIMAPHLWNFAKSRGAHIALHFHPAFQINAQDDRKSIAQRCWQVVNQPLIDKTQGVLQAA